MPWEPLPRRLLGLSTPAQEAQDDGAWGGGGGGYDIVRQQSKAVNFIRHNETLEGNTVENWQSTR